MGSLNKIFSKIQHQRTDRFSKLVLPESEFTKQLELYKLKSQIKPRKVNLMQSQDECAIQQEIAEAFK